VQKTLCWRRTHFWLLSIVLAAVGCESLYEAGVPGMEQFVDLQARKDEVARYQDEYLESKSTSSMRWLLANQLESGMTRGAVERVFAEKGERVVNDTWFKARGGLYRRSDRIYKWGPDANGNSVYLGFREGHLVNFRPSEFADSLELKDASPFL
jgi:hypothetical protein